jgi:membrane protein
MGYYKSLKNRVDSAKESTEDTDDLLPMDHNDEIDHSEQHPFLLYLQRTRLKALQGESLYNVGKYFFRSMFMENLNTRASSLSFNFFLALFPAIIFLLTLIGYMPLHGLKSQFIQELSRVLPKQTFKEVHGTILEILNKQNSGLLSFGFITTIYFASNAFHLLINSFNRRLPFAKKKNWLQVRWKAVFMTFWISILIIFALLLLTWAYQSVSYITLHDWPLAGVYEFFILLLEYVVLAALFQIGISSIYYFGPSNSKKWRFLSAGSITATVLGGISTVAFGLYVNNFNTYNKVYGSIGAIIALMILIYINILTIIVGFELNVSIEKAIAQRERRNAGKITQ